MPAAQTRLSEGGCDIKSGQGPEFQVEIGNQASSKVLNGGKMHFSNEL